MVKTIKLSDETHKKLLQYLLRLQAKAGVRMSFDDAIKELLKEKGGKK